MLYVLTLLWDDEIKEIDYVKKDVTKLLNGVRES